MQSLLLRAGPNIISSLDQGSCQGKLLCVRCLQNVICWFYYIIILNLSMLRLGTFCVSVFDACCLYMVCPKPNCIWKTSRETSQRLLPSPSLSLSKTELEYSCNENYFNNKSHFSPKVFWVSTVCHFFLSTFLCGIGLTVNNHRKRRGKQTVDLLKNNEKGL